MTAVTVFFLGAIQNAVFTAVSRSRNSGDVVHHAKWAVASNGLWFAMQVFIFTELWAGIRDQEYFGLLIVGVFYVAGTSVGSVLMMWRMLKTENGSKRVGANNA